MSAFAVRLEVLADVLEQLAGFERDVEERLGELQSRMGRLQASWTGAAAEEQRAAHARWVAGAHEMRDAVATLRRVGAGAHANYRSAITANQRMWGTR